MALPRQSDVEAQRNEDMWREFPDAPAPEPPLQSSAPTVAQLAVLRWLLKHPGASGIFEYYDGRGRYLNGLSIVSRRGGAGRMRQRLETAGWIDSNERLTPAGYEIAEASDA